MWGPKEPIHDVGSVTPDAENGAQCAAPAKKPEKDLIDTFIRDACSVSPKSKSEMRKRLNEITEKALDDQEIINASIKDGMIKHYDKKLEEAEKNGRKLGADMAMKLLMGPIHECSVCKKKFKKVSQYTYKPDCEHFSKDIMFSVAGTHEKKD